MSKKFVCHAYQCPRDSMRAFDVDGGPRVLIVSSGDEYFAYQAICPHMEVELEEGLYDGSTITCHRHLWQWDVRTGAPVGLAELPLERYRVRVEDGTVHVLPLSALEKSELFSGISEATLDAIEKLTRRQTFEADSVIYKPGQSAEDVFVLESGRVEFIVGRDERTGRAGFTLRAGEVFGWAALVEDQACRIASAACSQQSTVAAINGKALLQLLADDPSAGYVVMRRLTSLITRHLTPAGAR